MTGDSTDAKHLGLCMHVLKVGGVGVPSPWCRRAEFVSVCSWRYERFRLLADPSPSGSFKLARLLSKGEDEQTVQSRILRLLQADLGDHLFPRKFFLALVRANLAKRRHAVVR